MPSPSSIEPILTRIDTNLDAALERLFAFLRIKSISTDPAYQDEVMRAAKWVCDDLTSIGFQADIRATSGHPMVVAHWHVDDVSAPHILFYGHYDVQPVDPLEEWDKSPFEPHILDDAHNQRIVARGAADDKGQLMTFIEACRSYVAETGELPLSVTILLEGEEESGSPSLVPFLQKHTDELKCDVALICDTEMWDAKTPAITASLRGLMSEEVEITTANRDLHSGYFGGVAQNANLVLARILAQLHDENGRVMLDGFYETVTEPSDAIKQQWQNLNFDAKGFLHDIGMKEAIGEKDRMILERLWSRPTADVNGMNGGYTGEGFKTVIPAKASAKVSFRLVTGQDPQMIQRAFHHFVQERLPLGASAVFTDHGASPAIALPLNSPFVQKATEALSEEWNCQAPVIGCGASIPIVGAFEHLLNMPSLPIGFGLADDRVHSPNEKYNLTSFHKGMRSWVRIIAAFAK